MSESMKDYEAEINASFRKIGVGDIVTGTVIAVTEDEVTLDLRYFAPGIIKAEDYSDDPDCMLKEAVAVGADIIMLDNMSVDTMKEAVKYIDKRAIVEASGNVCLQTVNAIASTGVDIISSSAIVAKAPTLDLALDM